MKTYKITVSSITYYTTEIEAENENEAFQHAKTLSGSDFELETYGNREPVSDWNISDIKEIK